MRLACAPYTQWNTQQKERKKNVGKKWISRAWTKRQFNLNWIERNNNTVHNVGILLCTASTHTYARATQAHHTNAIRSTGRVAVYMLLASNTFTQARRYRFSLPSMMYACMVDVTVCYFLFLNTTVIASYAHSCSVSFVLLFHFFDGAWFLNENA